MILSNFFRSKILYVSTGANEESIYDKVVVGKAVYIYNHIAIINTTSSYTRFRIGVDVIPVFHLHEEFVSPLVSVLYWTKSPLYVYPDERLQVKIEGATIGDKFEINVQGYLKVQELINA